MSDEAQKIVTASTMVQAKVLLSCVLPNIYSVQLSMFDINLQIIFF